MKTIDADTAKLAGLQIDMLQKLRLGHMTLDHIDWFNGLSKDTRDALMVGEKPTAKPTSPAEPTVKFALSIDLGEITVPDDYVHGKCLVTFRKKNGKKLYYCDDSLTDANFPNPTRILKPGDKLWVRAFKQIVPGTTTSEERMTFLATQNAIHTGAQGATLVFDQKRDQLPKGKWYASFDERDRLWRDSHGDHGVPGVSADSGGDFGFPLGRFECVWDGSDAFLCFCDLPVGETQPLVA